MLEWNQPPVRTTGMRSGPARMISRERSSVIRGQPTWHLPITSRSNPTWQRPESPQGPRDDRRDGARRARHGSRHDAKLSQSSSVVARNNWRRAADSSASPRCCERVLMMQPAKMYFASTSEPAAIRWRVSDFGTRTTPRVGSGTPGTSAP